MIGRDVNTRLMMTYIVKAELRSSGFSYTRQQISVKMRRSCCCTAHVMMVKKIYRNDFSPPGIESMQRNGELRNRESDDTTAVH